MFFEKENKLLNYLERPRAIRTLICLLKNEGKGLEEMLEKIGGSKTTGMKRIQELVEIGYATKKASQSESRKMLYCLEEDGRKIARELEKLLTSIQMSYEK